MHRDIKPENILIDSKNTLKIADFGLSRNISFDNQVLTHPVVTLWYRAPELLLGQEKYTYSIDMWSIGCIFFELCTKKHLFPGRNEIEMIHLIF